MKNKILSLLSILFPVSVFTSLISELKPYFCKHKMRYWDMKLVVDTDDINDPIYQKFNGMIWNDSFCQCQKCGVKMKRNYLPKQKMWKKSNFTTNKTNIIEVEVFQFGRETKRQKRDRLLNKLGI
jgi:hypothetical protein